MTTFRRMIASAERRDALRRELGGRQAYFTRSLLTAAELSEMTRTTAVKQQRSYA